MAGNVAVDIHRHGQTRDVGRTLLDMYCQRGGLTAEALRSDAEGIDLLQQFLFQLRIERPLRFSTFFP